jgi:hypothetical protein
LKFARVAVAPEPTPINQQYRNACPTIRFQASAASRQVQIYAANVEAVAGCRPQSEGINTSMNAGTKPASSNVATNLTLHRYFLNASRNRSLFLTKLQEGAVDHLHTMIHLDLWYGCLFVVVEGWRRERMRDDAVTALLRDSAKLALLGGYRNAVFHYGPDYIDPRQEKLFADPDFVEWVAELHDAMSDFFLRNVTGGTVR